MSPQQVPAARTGRLGAQARRSMPARRWTRATRDQNTVDLHCGVDHDAGSLVEFIIGFRQPGVFGVLAVHASDIGLRGSRLPCTRESSCEDPTLFTTTDSPEEREIYTGQVDAPVKVTLASAVRTASV